MKIKTSNYCPDSTYFTATDVEPTVNNDGSITIYNGKGTRSGWGVPSVTSTVVENDHDFASIHVGYHHKYRGGQQWYHFTTNGSETRRVIWQQMPDELRQRVIEAARDKAPAWAKSPGKLTTERNKPNSIVLTTYKIVKVKPDGTMVSLYDDTTEYKIGETLTETAKPGHNGGYYSQPTYNQLMNLWNTGELVNHNVATRATWVAVIKCKTGGRHINYPNGKIASSQLTPIEVVETWKTR